MKLVVISVDMLLLSMTCINLEKNLMLIHEVPLHDIKVGVWCAMSATRIIVAIFPYETTLTFF